MGNRAVINFGNGVGVYLHWNGGRTSIEAFLKAAKEFKIRSDDYGVARFCQLVGNWFGGGLSLGCGKLSQLDRDNMDNGEYVVKNWEIVRRNYFNGHEEIDEQKTEQIFQQVMEVNWPIFYAYEIREKKLPATWAEAKKQTA